MRLNAMRIMSSTHDAPPAAMVTKLFWATLHRDLGVLAMDVLGAEATLRTGSLPDGSPDYSRLQRLFLFSRSDTIYAGTNQIQRNIIGERALGLPKEPS
jgi:alkylation response protein AidB-like acyl-CoA dehydrogenase